MTLRPLQTAAANEVLAIQLAPKLLTLALISAWSLCLGSAAAAASTLIIAFSDVSEMTPYAIASSGVVAPLRVLDEDVDARLLVNPKAPPAGLLGVNP